MQFIVDNWQFFVALFCGILELILLIVLKKRPEVIDTSLFADLVEWIYIAESRFKIGDEKMAYVLEQAKERLKERFVEKDVRELVEFILSLPQKKGIKDEK